MYPVQLVKIPLNGPVSSYTLTIIELVTLIRNQPGVTAALWSEQHEDSKVVGIAIVWEGSEAQQAWSSSESGTQSLAQFRSLAKGGPLYNDIVIFSDDPLPVLKSKAVEQVFWTHPVSNINDQKKAEVEGGFSKFQKAMVDGAPDVDGGLVGGWGQSELEFEGVSCRRWLILIGWESVDLHYECKKTTVFLENRHWLATHEHVGAEMAHFHYVKSI